jgi:hypothetical protein
VAVSSPESQTVVRQQHLPTFVKVLEGLELFLQNKGYSPERIRESFATSVKASCLKCGISVKGEELVLVCAAPNSSQLSTKLQRLRQGYCARLTCDSYFYQLSFSPLPGLEWDEALPPQQDKEPEPLPLENTEAGIEQLSRRKAFYRRLAIGSLVLLGIIFLRQLYVGGTIPLIREPEDFKVDRTIPVEQPTPSL